MVEDPFQVLGLSPGATQEEIKKAYKIKAKEHHPDLHPDDPNATRRMNEINEAYDRLMNSEKYAHQRAQGQETGYSGRSSSQSGNDGPQHTGPYGAGGWYSDFSGYDFGDIFGFGSNSGQAARPTVEPGDSPEIQRAVQNIVSRQYQTALQQLSQIQSPFRNARWYYLSALANHGLGNTMTALEQIQKAVQIEPDHPTYRQTLQRFRQAGRTYQENGQGFDMNAMDMQRFCMRLCYLQMFCTFCRCC